MNIDRVDKNKTVNNNNNNARATNHANLSDIIQFSDNKSKIIKIV